MRKRAAVFLYKLAAATLSVATSACGAARPQQNVPASSSATVFVPLDSWVYPALDRLAALGYINVEFLGMRPWTRLECTHLVQDARDLIAASESDATGSAGALHSLESEFRGDLEA